MTVKRWPFEFIDFATGCFIARNYFEPHGDMYDVIEQRAAHFAEIEGVEIDIIECTVMPSGKIHSRARVGMRVRPSWWPDVIETPWGDPVCTN
jgi:hypothetical protein